MGFGGLTTIVRLDRGTPFRSRTTPWWNDDVGNTERDPNVYCDECGAVVRLDAPDGTRTPCSECGSMAQQVRILVEDTVTFRSEIRLAAREGAPGEVAPHLLFRSGDSWSYRLGRWLQRTMRIDRKADRYEETVTDPQTGDVVHHDSGPLSEHRGHGGARKNDK